ncbi:hypothetical protein NST81_01830 [Bacillus sp. FSL W8-0223]|uniref:hypothetical protein n=1 Tax=Bacillus sp. FSL W8-0223 TaxID=2954595 RepID=UPI0030FA2259
MSDKKQDIFQFLNELREKCHSLTNEKDIFENGVIKVPIEDLDKLIGIVEQKQREIERLKTDWNVESAKRTIQIGALKEQLQQTNEKIKRYEKALKGIKNDIETDYTQEEIALGEMTSLLTVIYEQVQQALEGTE